MKYNIGFIGTGKAACSFGKHIALYAGPDYCVSGYFGRTETSTQEAASFAGGTAFLDANELFNASDIIIFAVPDGAIASVWSENKSLAISSGKMISHLSGLHSSLIFTDANNSLSGSIHPITAIFDKYTAYEKLKDAYFTIEGGESFKQVASNLLIKTNNPFSVIRAEKKALYHAASSTVSNLVCALAYAGASLYGACDLPEEFAGNAWRTLFIENAQNIAALGSVQALTGPLERGDTDTITQHIQALASYDPLYVSAYTSLSSVLIEVAGKKHPDRDYSAIKAILSSIEKADKSRTE